MLRHIESFVTFRYVDTVAGWLGGWQVQTSYYCMQAVDTIDGIITAPQVYSAGTYIPYIDPTSTLSCPSGLRTEMEVA